MNPEHAPDFRGYLQQELVRRTKANPRYSLRAFALMLGVQSGFLSKILLGQRRVTPATVRRFGTKLALSPRDIDHYEKSASKKSGGTQAAHPSTIETPTREFRRIAYDHFQIYSDWYHFAILELALIDGFEPDARWIARNLGITAAEAQDAMDRLLRLGYVELDKKGGWKILDGDSTTLGTEETNTALRRMQKQVLELAIEALETTPVSERDQSTMTMAVDSTRLEAAKEKVKKFRRELCSFLEGGKKRDAVYHLSVSLYPVSKRTKA